MKRLNCVPILALFLLVFSFASHSQCPTSCSTVLTDCYEPLTPGSPCSVSATCTSSFKVPNFGWTKSGSTVTLTSLAICYVPGGTPPWSSVNTAGRLMGAVGTTLRPSATRTFNTTATNGAIFQCTVQSNGLWTVQLISGTAPGVGTNLSGGSYTL